MSRRFYGNKNRYEDGSRQSIGDYHVDQACSKLMTAAMREATCLLPEFTRREIAEMLFPPETILLVEKATLYLKEQYTINSYRLHPAARLSLDFEGTGLQPIASSSVVPQPSYEKLEKAIAVLMELQRKWMSAADLLRWFNKYATPGAVRAIWPTAMQLCPQSSAWTNLKEAPMRYTDPPDLAVRLPQIREATATVAAMALMPDSLVARRHEGRRLCLDSRSVGVIRICPIDFEL